MTVEGSRESTDAAMMARCVELSRIAVTKGEYPFATVIAREGKIVAEAINRSVREGDVSRHAEVIALSQVQKALGRGPLRHYTLYTNIEPCAMCSYCIREAWLGRVVYALESPVMGGLSKWNILRDSGIADRMPQVFGPAPEVASGVLMKETQQVWRDWNPLAWEMIKLRGLLTEPPAQDVQIQVRPAHSHSLWHHLQLLFMRRGRAAVALPAGPMADHSNL
jgi:tRNA(adenine34) deaminase